MPDTRSVSIMGQTPSARCSSMRPTAGKSPPPSGATNTATPALSSAATPISRASILPIMSKARKSRSDRSSPTRKNPCPVSSRNRWRASAWTPRARRLCRWTPTASLSRFARTSPRTRPRSPGCGRITPVSRKRKKSLRWRGRFVRNTWPNAAASIPASGSSARSCTVCARRPRCSTRPIPGSSLPTSFPPR